MAIDVTTTTSYTQSPIFDMAINHRHVPNAFETRHQTSNTRSQSDHRKPVLSQSNLRATQRMLWLSQSRPSFTSEASRMGQRFFCSEGQRVFLTPLGNVCVPNSHRSNTREASSIFPWDLCPQGFVPQTTNVGVTCNSPESLRESTRKPPNPYESGRELKRERTDFDKATQFSVAEPITTHAPPTSTPDTTAVVAEAKAKVTNWISATTSAPSNVETSKLCLPGQVVISTPDGKRCGFRSHEWLQSLGRPKCGPLQLRIETKQGWKCVDFDNLSREDTPCLPGQKLTKLKDRLECIHQDSRAADSNPLRDNSCTKVGMMLIQTDTQFSCQQVPEATIGVPTCQNDAEVFVKTKLGFECIDKDYAKLVCEDGFLLVRNQGSFECRESIAGSTLPAPEPTNDEGCRQGEVLVVEGVVNSCKRLQHNAHLCGAGFKPKPNTVDGSFVCESETKNALECPEGYHKTQSGTECLPIAPHTDLCEDEHFQELFGKQVDCNSGNLSAILVPCEEGYEVEQKPGGDENIAPMCRLINFVNIVCEEDQSCYTQPQQKSCDGRDTGSDSPCLALLRRVFSGCQPQCANGGSCHGDVCVCPPGLTGVACEEDVDECVSLEVGHCQHGCVNTFGSFHCACPFGYTLNSDKRSCKTIDCIPDCLNGGKCVEGLCQCPTGLHGNRCQSDINECATNTHDCRGSCRNTFGSFECICGGLTKLGVDGKTCQPRTDSCLVECRNGGKCENHHCACPPGFYGIACQLDVNECLDFDHGCSHRCLNTRGSYSCVCPTGMALFPDMKTCSKIITS